MTDAPLTRDEETEALRFTLTFVDLILKEDPDSAAELLKTATPRELVAGWPTLGFLIKKALAYNWRNPEHFVVHMALVINSERTDTE